MAAVSDHCCCGLFHIKRGTLLVGTCSLLSTSLNALLSFFGINRTSHYFYIEFCLVFIDITSVLALFYGVRHMRPNFLKPYVYVNIVWCVVLILLFISSLIQLIKGDEFSRKVAAAVAEILGLTRPDDSLQSARAVLIAMSLIGLLLSVSVNIWFLYVIFKCYQWMTTRSKKPFLLHNNDDNYNIPARNHHPDYRSINRLSGRIVSM